jgi:hypothetical protein
MSRSHHLDELRRRLEHADTAHTAGAAFAGYLLETAGLTGDDLDDDERRFVDWLAGWDADTVAGAARLIELAQEARR